MTRTGRFFDRLDQALGRLVFRTIGAGVGLMTLWVGHAAIEAVRVGEWAGAGVTGTAAVLFGAFTAYCFRRDRRLSDIED